MKTSHALFPAGPAILTILLLGSPCSVNAQGVDPQITSAKAAARDANIEDIVKIAQSTANKMGTGEIELTRVNSKALSRFMAEEIIAKTPAVSGPNRVANKVDELGETAAFISEAIVPNPGFKKLKTGANPNLLAILKGTLRTAKTTAELLAAGVIRDVVASVALTVHNNPLITDAKEAKIQSFLFANRAFIAGSANKKTVKFALREGFSGGATANLSFEDGNIDALAQVSDPETDFRPQ